jgi:CHAT domain-containing protein/Tfp pilus assembly protein PilF
MRHIHLHGLWLCSAAGVALGIAAHAGAGDDGAEFNRINTEFRALCAAAKYQQAEPLGRKLLALAEGPLKDQPLLAAGCANNLAFVYDGMGRYSEAERLLRRALAINERLLAPDDLEIGNVLNNLGVACLNQAKYTEAEKLVKRGLTIREKKLKPGDPLVGASVNNLAIINKSIGRLNDAEMLYRRSLEIKKNAFSPDHLEVAIGLHNLGGVLHSRGRAGEAEELYRQALKIREQRLPRKHPDIASSLENLGVLLMEQQRYAEAELLLRQALSIREDSLGPAHVETAQALNNLAVCYVDQNRLADAEPLYRRALLLRQEALAPDHPDVAASLNNLAALYKREGRWTEAESLLKRTLGLYERTVGPDHRDTAIALNNLASLYEVQSKYADAELLFRRALAIHEKIQPNNHPDVAHALRNLANVLKNQRRYQDAQPLIDRAIAMETNRRAGSGDLFQCYQLRSQIDTGLGRSDSALVDLQRALDYAEDQRTKDAGDESSRAIAHEGYLHAYERMVAMHAAAGRVALALDVIERMRARELLDQMRRGGIDLLAGVPAEKGTDLRRRESETRGRVADLKRRSAAMAQRMDVPDDERSQQLTEIEKALYEAQQTELGVYREMQSVSRAYRLTTAADQKRATLQEVQELIDERRALLLVYQFGDEQSFVLVAAPGAAARIEELKLSQEAATRLGLQPGPLGMIQVRAAFDVNGDHVAQLLANPARAAQANARLAELWKLLVPASDRVSLLNGTYERLVVIPDGPVSLLPLDALITELAEKPRFLVDSGPPVLYAPSVSVLLNLVKRPRIAPGLEEPVLSVADPDYAKQASVNAPVLARLPSAALESGWVVDLFRQQGLSACQLLGPQATEQAVRDRIRNRRIIHFACHGFSDQMYGNLRGALALTAGPNGHDPGDDGFLTLSETYALDLRGSELTILSACRTNYGPQVTGEGVFALSRGFLVAGSRRVMASNWLVDDKAAASLVSYFCAGIAQSGKDGTVDYAAALQKAKRWTRAQDGCQSPFYWAAFSLIGPN